jgi:hypothetical protein
MGESHNGPVRSRGRDLLRRRPEIWFVPAIALAVVTSFTDVGQAVLGPAVIRRLTLVTPDPILPFTLAGAVVCGVLVFLTLTWRTGLGVVRSVIVSVSAPIGAVGGFEIPYQVIRDQVYPSYSLTSYGYHSWLALGAWVIVGLTGMGYWRWTWKVAALLASTAAGFLIWWELRYPQVTSSIAGDSQLAYLFNVSLKFAAFALFTLPLFEARDTRVDDRRTSAPPPSDTLVG